MIYAVVLIVMISTGVCHHVAKRHGLNVTGWIMLGALFGPFAVPFVYVAAAKRNSSPDNGKEGPHA